MICLGRPKHFHRNTDKNKQKIFTKKVYYAALYKQGVVNAPINGVFYKDLIWHIQVIGKKWVLQDIAVASVSVLIGEEHLLLTLLKYDKTNETDT